MGDEDLHKHGIEAILQTGDRRNEKFISEDLYRHHKPHTSLMLETPVFSSLTYSYILIVTVPPSHTRTDQKRENRKAVRGLGISIVPEKRKSVKCHQRQIERNVEQQSAR